MSIKRLFIMIVAFSLYSCQSPDPIVSTMITQTEATAIILSTPTDVEKSEEWALWSTSPHATEESSIASIQDRQIISCNVCHETTGIGVSSLPVWRNPSSGQYEAMANSTALCSQCHRDIETSNHQNEVNNPIHGGFECTDCHNPHSTAASCSDSNCHQNIKQERVVPPSTPTGGQHPNSAAFCGGSGCHPSATAVAISKHSIHGSTHAIVACTACHDASGLQPGPSMDAGTWVTFRTIEIDGISTTIPQESHDLQINVDCSRCHFKGNSWGLPLVTGDEFK